MPESAPLAPQAADEASTMLEDEVEACAFHNWYEKFKDVTLRSCVIPLPEDFVRFLLADGISMPSSAVAQRADDDDDSEWGDGGSDSDDLQDRNQPSGNSSEVPSFRELQIKTDEAIASLGGFVLPKLNWSAPKDARWVLGGLKCDNALDVFTLMKASDFVAHDLCHSFDHCVGSRQRPDEFSLVLRRWYDLNQAGEFRCFVHRGQLIAVSQRHTSAHFPHLNEAEFINAVVEKVGSWFEKHIRNNFPLQRYAFDVYVNKPPRMKVSLIDFSPWGATTDPSMFDWEELHEIATAESAQLPVIKTVKSEADIRTKIENYHALPLEVAQLGTHSSEELEEMCRRAQAGIAEQQS